MLNMKEKLLKQIEFIHEIDKIKSIFRKSKLFHDDRHENDAEHSWHLCMMAVVFSEYANEEINLLKVIKMLLMHDIVEIDTGDVIFYKKGEEAFEKEKLAAERIFGMLPAEQKDEYISLWQEFEEKKSIEARFAASLDRMEPLLQNIYHKCELYNENSIAYERVIKMNSHVKDGSDTLWEYIREQLEKSRDSGLFGKIYEEK